MSEGNVVKFRSCFDEAITPHGVPRNWQVDPGCFQLWISVRKNGWYEWNSSTKSHQVAQSGWGVVIKLAKGQRPEATAERLEWQGAVCFSSRAAWCSGSGRNLSAARILAKLGSRSVWINWRRRCPTMPGGLVRRKWQVKTGFVENVTKTGINRYLLKIMSPILRWCKKIGHLPTPGRICCFAYSTTGWWRMSRRKISWSIRRPCIVPSLWIYVLQFNDKNSMETYGKCLSQHTAHRFHPESFKIEWKCQSWCAYIYIYCRYNHYVTYDHMYIYIYICRRYVFRNIYIYIHKQI